MAVLIVGDTPLEPIDVVAFLTVVVAFILCVARLILHLHSSIASSKSPYHISVTLSLSACIASQITGTIFRYYQRGTQIRYEYRITPENVLLVTKICGCLSVIFATVSGMAFGFTTLNRFKPFADGFGFHPRTTSVLLGVQLLLTFTSIIGGCVFVLEYRNIVVTVTNILFWAYTAIFDLVVMVAMVWATVAKKRVIFQSNQETQSHGSREIHRNDAKREDRPLTLIRVLGILLPTIKRSDRSLVALLAVILFLDLVSVLGYVGAAVYRPGFIAILYFNTNALLGFYILVAFEFLAQFRNVLGLEGKRRDGATQEDDGTVELTSHWGATVDTFRETTHGNDGVSENDHQTEEEVNPQLSLSITTDLPARATVRSDPRHFTPVLRQQSVVSNVIHGQQRMQSHSSHASLRSETPKISQILPNPANSQLMNLAVGERSGAGNLHSEDTPPVPAASSESVIFFSVSIPYRAIRSDELDLTPGDRIRCDRTYADGWGYGTHLANGRSGVFPLNSCSVQEKTDRASEAANFGNWSMLSSGTHLPRYSDDGPPELPPNIQEPTRRPSPPLRLSTSKMPANLNYQPSYAAPNMPLQDPPNSFRPEDPHLHVGRAVFPPNEFPTSQSGQPIRLFGSATATAIRTFEPMHSDEVPLNPGNRMAIAAEYADGYAYGANLSLESARGMFPLAYCEWDKDSSSLHS
ncbi:hypothetical protein BJ742DRAFT_531633 [Cladochytrium replicatum]|nr:hypothetical protein BJ742DRAFT_531633 [Cladochytrium replicatum]